LKLITTVTLFDGIEEFWNKH